MSHFSRLEDLAGAVDSWCQKHRVAPLSGQAAPALSVRSLRYYRTLGLLAGPDAAGHYGRQHFCQLASLRVLQAKGQPLKEIQRLLYGRTLAELEVIVKQGPAEMSAPRGFTSELSPAGESWFTLALDEDFLLVSRSGRRLPPEKIEALRAVLSTPTLFPSRSSQFSTP